MAIWPYIMGGAAATVAASYVVGNAHAIQTSALILAGLLGARVIMASPISGEYRDVVFAAMWITVASFIQVTGYVSVSTMACVKAAIVVCALCSLWGRLTSYNMQIWSPPYMTADVMLILAIVLIGWGIRSDLVGTFYSFADRGRALGYDTGINGVGPMDSVQSLEANKAQMPEAGLDG